MYLYIGMYMLGHCTADCIAHVNFKQHNRYYVPRQDAQYKYVIVDFDVAISLKILKSKNTSTRESHVHTCTYIPYYVQICMLSW